MFSDFLNSNDSFNETKRFRSRKVKICSLVIFPGLSFRFRPTAANRDSTLLSELADFHRRPYSCHFSTKSTFLHFVGGLSSRRRPPATSKPRVATTAAFQADSLYRFFGHFCFDLFATNVDSPSVFRKLTTIFRRSEGCH